MLKLKILFNYVQSLIGGIRQLQAVFISLIIKEKNKNPTAEVKTGQTAAIYT